MYYINVFTIIALIHPWMTLYYTRYNTFQKKKKKKKKKNHFQNAYGPVLGRRCVTSIEFWLLVGVIIIVSIVSILAQFKLTQIATTRVVLEVKQLDSSLVEVVEKLMDGGILEQAQDMNPVQMLLAQFIQKKIESMPQDVAVVTPVQDESGKFTTTKKE